MAKINAKTTGGGGVETIADSTGVLELQSAGTTMATISPSGFNLGSGTPSAQTALSPYTGFKNRIINGAMMIDQRNNGASYTTQFANTNYTLDRWRASVQQSSKFSVQQNAGSVTPPAGFTNYLGCTSLSAYTVGASENFDIRQIIEGFNIADLGWGTANAAPVTLSFWVRSSLTGTFGGTLRNSDVSRSYPYSYTISAANTWEYKTITIAGDTAGTWLTNNNSGLGIVWSLGAGSSVSGTAGAWVSAGINSVTGATSVVGTSGATFYITGVQLEKGSTATSFDYRPYGTELSLCQRYFEKSYAQSFAPATATVAGYITSSVNSTTTAGYLGFSHSYKVTKRASPTVVIYDTAGASGSTQRATPGVGQDNGQNATVGGASDDSALVVFSVSGTSRSQLVCHFTASAEL
jgi:hypothetical protein